MAGYLETGRILGANSTLSPLGMVHGSLMAAKDWAERARHAEAERRQDAYQDDYRDVLTARISETFTGANAEELVKVLDTTNNPLKRIVNEVSVLYTKRPSRKLDGAPGSTALYRQILKRAGDGVVMPRLNRMCNLHNTVLLYVRPAYDSLTLRLILPQDATVWPDPDDPTMPLCVEFRECDPAAPNAKPVYHQFDRRPESAGYRKYDSDGKEIKSAALPPQYFDGDRPLIPIVAFHREFPDYSFWDSTSGDDLYELTIMVGMWETWINHLIRTDSFRQKYATGEVDVSTPQEGGPTGMLSFRPLQGGTVSVGEFSSQADWNGLGAQIVRKLNNVFNNMGMVLPDTRTSGDPTSGYALWVRASGLRKLISSQRPSYERSEESLYRVVSAVWNFERENSAFQIEGEALPPVSEADPCVLFADVEDVQYTADEKAAQIANDKEEIALGIASPITVYMRIYPEATEEEARAAIEKNKADADEGGEEVDPMTALNGAQVTSLVEVVKSVATKQIPRETGIEMIVASFPLDRETATRLMGATGDTFFAEQPTRPAPFGQPPQPDTAEDAPPEDEADGDAPPRK